MIGNAGKPHVHHWNQRGLDEGTVTVYVCAVTKWRGERERERGEVYVLSMILSLFFIVVF